MTGFARTDGTQGPARWHWELRSVNGRGLDLRFRLPPGFDSLEPRLREAAQRRLTRGSVTISLTLHRDTTATEIRLNEAVLTQVVRAAARVRELTGGEPPRVDALLAIRGVLEVLEPEDGAGDELAKDLMATFEQALNAMVEARASEGTRLAAVISDRLSAIEIEVAKVTASPARSVEAISTRIAEQVARLTDASPALDPGRLHQEAILLATRSDVEEELKRLGSHVAAARELIASKDAVGRKLDFLAQEFNREANTLCSKANDAEITRAGLQLKTVIDQLREQIQNIE
ncbi:MAG: YicC/YloC family endoribonuclease [Hyphomicrobiaceae bacterium]